MTQNRFFFNKLETILSIIKFIKKKNIKRSLQNSRSHRELTLNAYNYEPDLQDSIHIHTNCLAIQRNIYTACSYAPVNHHR